MHLFQHALHIASVLEDVAFGERVIRGAWSQHSCMATTSTRAPRMNAAPVRPRLLGAPLTEASCPACQQ